MIEGNEIIGIHIVNSKYLNEIRLNGINRKTSGIFYLPKDMIDRKNSRFYDEFLNTMEILIYHGISLKEWNLFGESDCDNIKTFLKTTKLVILIFKLEHLDPKILFENSKYYFIDNTIKKIIYTSLPYIKIKNLGSVKKENIINECILNIPYEVSFFRKKLDCKNEYDRFFYNNYIDDRNFSSHNLYSRDIYEFCKIISEINYNRILYLLRKGDKNE